MILCVQVASATYEEMGGTRDAGRRVLWIFEEDGAVLLGWKHPFDH